MLKVGFIRVTMGQPRGIYDTAFINSIPHTFIPGAPNPEGHSLPSCLLATFLPDAELLGSGSKASEEIGLLSQQCQSLAISFGCIKSPCD